MTQSLGRSNRQFHTSEAVTEGHPDKIADQISDAILDEVLRQDPFGRVAVEVLVTGRNVVIAGEVTTSAKLNVEGTARKVIREAGYTDTELGFDADSCRIDLVLQQQSKNIGDLVGKSRKENPRTLGAGDQGIMYGYATEETRELMPLPILLANRLVKRLAEVRKRRIIPYLRPDGKSQVTVEYRDGKPERVRTILVSAQHHPDIELSRIRRDIVREVIQSVIPKKLIDQRTQILTNKKPFDIGGPIGDTGLTGRKVMVDTYGGVGSHGGGSFSGKDPTKVDRSASYAARWAAKNLAASGLCRVVEIQLAYAIGRAKPVAINVTSHGTSELSDERLSKIVRDVFDFRPGMIIRTLQLRRPIYRSLSVYGHFGRTDLNLPWECLDKVEAIRRLL